MKEFKISKKIVLIMMSMVLILGLASCGGYDKLGSLELNKNGVKSVVTYYGEDKIAYEQTSETEINFKKAGITDKKVIKDVTKQVKELGKKYDDLKGVEHELSIDKDGMKESLKIDFKKVDYDKAKKIQGLLLTKDPKNGVDYEASKKMLKDLGFKEVK